MLRKATRNLSALLESGPRALVITRAAKRRGAAQKTREFAALVSLVSKRDLAVVMEIGSLHGGTLWAWCAIALSDALIVSVDLPGGAFGSGCDDEPAGALHGYARDGQSITLIQDDSHRDETKRMVVDALAGRSVDLLFIDGDHTYEGVKRDFEMYAPLVRDGGVIAFHDILEHPGDPTCQVDVFWRELRERMPHVEFTDPADVRSRGQWGGIGVVFGLAPSGDSR